MSWGDSNSIASTIAMNKEHEKFNLNSKLEYFAQNILLYVLMINNIRFTVSKKIHGTTMGKGWYHYHDFTIIVQP